MMLCEAALLTLLGSILNWRRTLAYMQHPRYSGELTPPAIPPENLLWRLVGVPRGAEVVHGPAARERVGPEVYAVLVGPLALGAVAADHVEAVVVLILEDALVALDVFHLERLVCRGCVLQGASSDL